MKNKTIKQRRMRLEQKRVTSNIIRECLDEINMSQADLARKSFTTKYHIYKIVNNKQRGWMSLSIAMRIAKVLGKQVEELFSLEA